MSSDRPPVSITSIRRAGFKPSNIPNHSGYLITVNTNYRPTNREEATEIGDVLDAGMKECFDERNIGNFVEFYGANTQGHAWDKNTIEKVEGEFNVELGDDPKGSRVHSHATIHIYHFSHIRLRLESSIVDGKNKPGLREFLSNYMIDNCSYPISSVYLNVRMISGDANLARYLRKDPI